MDGETMALEAVGSPCPHGRVLYRREMASQAVAVCDLFPLVRHGNGGRINLQCFMVEIVKAGFGLVCDFADDVCIGEMTLYAGKLLVVGDMPP